MKRLACLFFAVLVGTALASQVPARRDATAIRPELEIDPSGGVLRVRGCFRVVNPDIFDHVVIVRLVVRVPDTGDEIYSEDISKFDYPSNHAKDIAYPIRREWDMDVSDFETTIEAIGIGTGREFASIVLHHGHG